MVDKDRTASNGELEPIVVPEVQCGAKAAACACSLPPHGDEVPHHCQAANCGGQWRGSYEEESFDVIRMPGEFRLTPGLFVGEW